jgi:tellurite resistance protein TehA-like permease
MKLGYALATAMAVAVILAIVGSCLHPSPLAWPGFPPAARPLAGMAAAPTMTPRLPVQAGAAVSTNDETWVWIIIGMGALCLLLRLTREWHDGKHRTADDRH